MRKQSWMIAAALLALSLTGCSAPTESADLAAESPYEPIHIEQTVESKPAEEAEVHENVPLSFSVGDETEEKVTDAAKNATDTAPENLPPDAESDTTAPAQQTLAEETPIQPETSSTASPAQPAAPAESQPPAEPSADSAPVPEPPPVQQPLHEQLPEPTPQPEPVPIPAPEPAPAPQPESTPTPQPEPAPQPVDIGAIVQQAQAYGLSIGLEWDATATDCWDNPITATPQSLYVFRDLCGRLDWYKSNGFEAFCIWSETTGDGSYLIYVGYA